MDKGFKGFLEVQGYPDKMIHEVLKTQNRETTERLQHIEAMNINTFSLYIQMLNANFSQSWNLLENFFFHNRL